MIQLSRRLALLTALASASASAQTQTGGFVIRLGTDTVHIERFSRTAERLDGTIVTRSPETRVITYSLTFTADGLPRRYEFATARVDGTPLRANGHAGSIEFAADSLTREVLKDGQVARDRLPSRPGIFPAPSLPYIGTTVLFYEMGFAAARARANAAGEANLPHVAMIAGFPVTGTKVWFVGLDSVEMDYFGVTRRGFRLDAKGQLTRADWSKATYAYRIERVRDIDVQRVASAWGAGDRAGSAMGALSPQDTVRANVGTANVMITYSRPSKRGRVIWGGLVPWNAVWRFGADFATHLSTTVELQIGATTIPAGRYTLWMLPSASGESMLIVNTRVNIFGTAYNGTGDFARIPLTRNSTRAVVERFTIAIEDERFWARWDDTAWSVPITAK